MIGRVIGKGGDTIKALQHYTGAVIQIDQSETCTIAVAGSHDSVQLALKMISDIINGVFKVGVGCLILGCLPAFLQTSSGIVSLQWFRTYI